VGPLNGAGYAQYSLQNTFRPGSQTSEQTGQSKQSQLATPPSPDKNTGQNVGQTSQQQPVQSTKAADADLTRVSTAPDRLESPLTGTSSDRGQNLDISI